MSNDKDFEEEDSSLQISDKELSNIYNKLLIDSSSIDKEKNTFGNTLYSIIQSKEHSKLQNKDFNERKLLYKAKLMLAKDLLPGLHLKISKNKGLYKKLCKQILENKKNDTKIIRTNKMRASRKREFEGFKNRTSQTYNSPAAIDKRLLYGKRAVSILRESCVSVFVKKGKSKVFHLPKQTAFHNVGISHYLSINLSNLVHEDKYRNKSVPHKHNKANSLVKKAAFGLSVKGRSDLSSDKYSSFSTVMFVIYC